MSAPGSHQAESLKLLRELAAEADALQQAAGGSVTDAVSAWLAPQYLLAAREQLTATAGTDRLPLLRHFVQDWALLRRGDHQAERLQLDRERLELARQDARKKWEPKIESGLAALAEHIKGDPQAAAAFEHFKAVVSAGEGLPKIGKQLDPP